jgi:nuclear pore complex protein Nup98-Nup96
LQDYAQNRKTASTSAFGTGQPTFGTTQPTTTATATTGAGIFGSQTNQPAQNSLFSGGQTNTTGGFGAFGQANQPSTTQPAAGIFGGTAFGQQQQPQQQPQQQQASTFGTFGQQNQPQQQQQQQQAGGIFGGSAFGSTANKPGFGTTGAFGTRTYLGLHVNCD